MRFYILSAMPAGIKKVARSKYLAVPFATYVNIRCLLESDGIYGQLREDEEIRQWRPEEKGSYLDIGAGYPVRGSNTYYFYRRGWRGTAIEPIGSNALVFKIFRFRDKVIKSTVGSYTGKVPFYHIEPYEYSTTDDEIAREMLARTDTHLVSRSLSNQISVSDLGVKMQPQEPTLISIDAEGADLDILQSIPWNFCRPRLICVEEWADKVDTGENVRSYLERNDYSLVKNLSPSLIFVSNEYLRNKNKK